MISTVEPSNFVPGSSYRHAQLLKVGSFKTIWNLDKIYWGLSVIISVIIHKNNITQTHDHRSVYELFRSYSYDPKQNRSTAQFQTFDTASFILSLERTSKKIHKTLEIILPK